MFSLESDEMTALWPNDSLTFVFYGTNWTDFVKEDFGFDTWFTKWRNDSFISKWHLNSFF